MTCYLIRHGKDDDSVRGGWSESLLTDEGITQVHKLAASMSSLSISNILTSDLPRARQTAEIISNQLGVPVIPRSEFRETNNGVLAGMKNELANVLYPGLYWSTLDWEESYPGGESPKSFFERIYKAWKNLKAEMDGQQNNFVLVTHTGVINAILCIENNVTFTNKTLHFPSKNAEMIAIEI